MKGLELNKVLYVYNMKRVKLEDLVSLIKNYENVEGYWNDDFDNSKGYIEFRDLESALRVLCQFKNMKVLG